MAPKVTTYKFSSPDGLDLSLDIYGPTKSFTSDPLPPALLFFHAGGLVAYNQKLLPPYLVQVCPERGWPLVSADYRLFPQVGGIEFFADTVAAYDFVVEKLLARKIIIAGASAGAFLSFLLGTMAEPTPTGSPEPL